jgi:glycosyltransferase involved in cell wall biosynthesis
MRVALVHDWLTGMRGGEKVLAAIGALFPEADLFTLIQAEGACQSITRGRKVVCSFLNDLPGVERYYRRLLPIMPWAIGQMELRGYDLVISSSHCVAKGIRPGGARHICYCHTPMRYLWSQSPQYARHSGRVTRMGMASIAGYLKAWELRSAARVDAFIANSRNVAQRIGKTYGRTARVIYPPIDTEFFTPANVPREEFYLVVSALVPYKCIDHAMEATARLGRPLRIVGSGPMLESLKKRAPKNVRFLGWVSDEKVREHYRRCRALLLPGEEDFGMAVVEATACGAPVIAYKAGGALETVVDWECGSANATGILYEPQTVEGLTEALKRFESESAKFNAHVLRNRAERFGPGNFRERFMQAVDEELQREGGANRDIRLKTLPALRRRLTSITGKIIYPATARGGSQLAETLRATTVILSRPVGFIDGRDGVDGGLRDTGAGEPTASAGDADTGHRRL